MSGRFAAGNEVAIVGYAHSPVLRRADLPLGAQAVNTARAAIADAGLHVDQIDGFVSSSLLPSAGGQGAEDGISIVSSAWLAQRLGAQPCYVAGFEGIGQITGVGRHRRQRDRQRRGRLRPVAPRTAQSGWALPRQPDAGSVRPTAMDCAAGLFRAAGYDRVALQRVPSAIRRIAGIDGRRRGGGTKERRAHPVVVLARSTARCRRIPVGARCFSIRCAATTAISLSTVSRPSCSPPPTAPTICHIDPSMWPAMRAACPLAVDFRCTGRSMTSLKAVRS